MDIYLVRHAKAEVGVIDDARALTESGRRAAQRVGARLADRGIELDLIEHSPLVRAVQTAEILAEHLGIELRETDDLGPKGDPSEVRERLVADHDGSQAVMLVGHNPFMEEMASLLLVEDVDRPTLVFHTTSVARFVPNSSGGRRYSCDWLLTPGLLK